MNYQKYLKNRKRIFSITASSDQILNSILEGSEEIISCDISRWPSYFYELKKAAVFSLTREEYIEFFISEHNEHLVFNDLLYDKLVDNLSENARKFWDSLFLFFEGEDIYYSPLFSRETLIEKHIINTNPYLQGKNYDKLRDRLGNVKVSHQVGNIKDIEISELPYDFVNLSSIIYYSFHDFSEYEQLVERFPLNENGIVLTYLYHLREEIKNHFSDKKNYQLVKFNKSNHGLLVYQKK